MSTERPPSGTRATESVQHVAEPSEGPGGEGPRATGGVRATIREVGRTSWALLGIIGLLVLIGLVAGRLTLIVVPVVLALFPATLLVPVAAKLKSVGFPDSLSAITSMILGFLLIGGLIGAMIPLVVAEVPALIDSASSGVEQIEAVLEDDPLGLGISGPSELLAAGREQVGEIGDYTDQAVTAASTAFETLAGLLLLFVVLFFYLKDGRRLIAGLLSVAPKRSRPRLGRAADRAWKTLGSYFRGQLLVALFDAVFIGIGLLILGIPLAVPLAVLIFFGGLFPLVGAVATGTLAVLVALADGGLTTALIVLGLILVVQQVEGNLLQPLIIGRAIDLHPLVVILAITAGGVLLGILGAFLAVPAAAILARVVADDPGSAAADEGASGTESHKAEDLEQPRDSEPTKRSGSHTATG